MTPNKTLSITFFMLGVVAFIATIFYAISISQSGALSTFILSLFFFLLAYLHRNINNSARYLTWAYVAWMLFFSVSNMIYGYTQTGTFLLSLALIVFVSYWNMKMNSKDETPEDEVA